MVRDKNMVHASQLKIVAIGGGELRKLETLRIDRRIVELAGKPRPKALFIPTASGDSDRYVDAFTKLYGGKLGCRVSVLRLLRNRPSRSEITHLVQNADLVYVGGGNTLRLMRRWRALGVDAELAAAARRGTVLAGLSAGAICWFRYGESDSRSFSGSPQWEHIRVRGLGLIPLLYCPHYHSEKREKPLAGLLAKRGGKAVACDDHAAIEILGDRYRIITSRPGAKAYFLEGVTGKTVRRPLPPSRAPRPLSELTGRLR